MEWIEKRNLRNPPVLVKWEPLYGKDQCVFFDDEGYLCQISKEAALQTEGVNLVVPICQKLSGPAYLSPIMVQIKITNACNFNCRECYSKSGKKDSKEMSVKQIKELLNSLVKWGVLIIQWVGGEVFLKKGFENLVAYAYELGFQQYLLTNGSIFGQKPEIFSKDAWEYFFSIQISVDGVEDSFDRHVQKEGAWKFVEKGLMNLGRTKPEFHQLKIATISTKEIVPNISLIGEKLSRIDGINAWKLGKEISSGRSKITEQESIEAQIKVWEEIKKISTPFEVQTYFDKENTPKGIPPELFDDPGTRDFMYIFHNGDAYPRPLMAEQAQFYGGNCLSDSLKNIWYSENFQTIRSITRKDTGCENCKLTCTQRGLDQRLNLFKNCGINFKIKPFKHPGCEI